ncbi:MAG: AbrB family transcriptional regulator [Thermoprotei archaeon]|nr:MAG: AbrB family transcriptional regulator [Thermoprotei archaeon]
MPNKLVHVSKVNRGVIALPKAIRDAAGITERSLVRITFENGKITIEPLKVRRVRLPERAKQAVEEALREELKLEEAKADRLVKH